MGGWPVIRLVFGIWKHLSSFNPNIALFHILPSKTLCKHQHCPQLAVPPSPRPQHLSTTHNSSASKPPFHLSLLVLPTYQNSWTRLNIPIIWISCFTEWKRQPQPIPFLPLGCKCCQIGNYRLSLSPALFNKMEWIRDPGFIITGNERSSPSFHRPEDGTIRSVAGVL